MDFDSLMVVDMCDTEAVHVASRSRDPHVVHTPEFGRNSFDGLR